MAFILPRPGYFVKERFLKRFRDCRQALVRIRYLIIVNNWNGRSAREIATVLKIHNTTVYRIVRNFRERGEATLWDGREDNGHEKLDADFLGLLDRVVRSNPQEHGWRRPTWTRETLVETMVRKTGVRIHVANYSIHSSNIIAVALANFASRVRLHFLPPYSPDDNAIERVWKDLHANVTRNHNCGSMTELMAEVHYYLRTRNRRTQPLEASATAA